MTLHIERARARRPITWLTLLGVLLLPMVIGGILVAALYNPVERLDTMHAAIVNDDEPVTVNGQLAPLGRQLTAGLVGGGDEGESNLAWTISNEDDAAAGLADGRYSAVVTIPENFSAAATSTAGSDPVRAEIAVRTAPDARVVDDAITAQVTQAAASLLGQQLSEVYLENVFLGFTTLGGQLGDAAAGADQLATGAGDAAAGATSLADGVRQLSSGAAQLGTGATGVADGAGGLATGAGSLASGLDTIAGGITSSATGATGLSQNVSAGAAQLRANGIVPSALVTGAAQTATGAQGTASAVDALIEQLTTLQATACGETGTAQLCTDATTALATARDGVKPAADGTATGAAGVRDGISGVAAAAPEQIASQFDQIATGAGSLAGGLTQLATGTSQSADGARSLESGATRLQTGAAQLATGAGELASGAGTAADGADSLSSGVGQLASGSGTLASGLDEASGAIPSYTDAQAQGLANVVADPVTAAGVGSSLFGTSAIPLLATLALWFGGFASFVALQAVSRRALVSRAPSALLALRALAPAAAIGALQGLLVAGVVQVAASYDWADWWVFAALCVVAGVAFAAVNQALVAVFGGFGRWIAALVGVLVVATGVVSTVPGFLASIAGLAPTAPAYDAMLGALTTAGGVGAGFAGMLIWAVLAFLATTFAVVRRRTTSARALLAASPA